MNKKLTLILVSILLLFKPSFGGPEAGRITISGNVRDASNGETLIGASIYISELKTGTITNSYGFYSLSILPGKYTLVCSYVGFSSATQTIDLKSNITLKRWL
jgi:hypothetical protein